MLTTLKRWNISAGNFFFKCRNFLFPVVFLLLFLLMKPAVLFESPLRNEQWMGIGAGLVLLGQALRVLTIGYEYIERGGRKGKVHASFLVQGGVYAHTRNPMYLGNGLIAVGFILYSASPLAMLIAIPFFLFVYQSIIAAEEHYLLNKFGDEYRQYCSQVNRFVPSLKGIRHSFAGKRYDWKKVLRKEYGTLFVVASGLIIIPAWRDFVLVGPADFRHHLPAYSAAFGVTLVGYATARILKKRGCLKSTF